MSQIEPRSFYTLNSKILNKKKGNMSQKKTINVALIIVSLFVLLNTSLMKGKHDQDNPKKEIPLFELSKIIYAPVIL